MGELDMTTEEREAFLAGVHIGVLAVERAGKGPLALPIWYQYEPAAVDDDDQASGGSRGSGGSGGEVVISMDGSSLKARLLSAAGRATLTVQDERPPYRYVMVEGPVTIGTADHDDLALATRYLGEQMGAWYAERNPVGPDSVTVRLRPQQWLTCDYGKAT